MMGAWRYIVALKNIVIGQLSSPLRLGNIAMFHFGRCGSTVLGDLLNQHPDIFWDGEIFNEDIVMTLPAMIVRYIKRHPMQSLRLRMARAGKRIYGFETLLIEQSEFNGFQLLDYVEQLQAMGFNCFIILKRRNYLRKLVSSVIADKTLRWHQTYQENSQLIQIELALDEIQIGTRTKPLMTWLQNFHERFLILEELLSNQKVLQLTYEDDIASVPLVAYERICDFLGFEHHPVSVRYGKTNPYKLTELISNFDEVEHELWNTPFEWMLYE